LTLFPKPQNYNQIDCPIAKVLCKLELASRMMAWSIELLEYKIQYEPRGTIKAQSLIDFMNEFHPPILKPPDEWWELNIDESSNQHNNGAWVTLEGSNNVALAKSLHFRFKATNNQAEYEALLVGLRLAKEVRARKVKFRSDDSLVAS